MRRPAFALIATLSIACSTSRQEPPVGAKQVEWTAVAGPTRPAADGGYAVDVDVSATIADGWHVYSVTQAGGGPVPLSVKVGPLPPYSLAGNVTGPQPEKEKDPNFGVETETYSHQASIRVPVRIASPGAEEFPPLELKVRSQACSDRVCLPAKTTTLVVQPQAAKT